MLTFKTICHLIQDNIIYSFKSIKKKLNEAIGMETKLLHIQIFFGVILSRVSVKELFL